LTGSTVYTATITGGTSGVEDLAGNALVSNYVWSFATTNVDNTPPTVSSVSPVSGSAGVSVSTTVTANFNEAINTSTVTTSTFQLRNPANTLITAAVSVSGNQITLTPSTALVNSTVYTVTITGGESGVKDAAGNALASDYNWSFTTAAATSQSPVTIQSFTAKTGTAATVHSLTGVPAGALLVLGTTADAVPSNAIVSSSPSLTWTKRVDAGATNSDNAEIWTAVYAAGGTITVTSNWGTGNSQSSVCYVVLNAESVLGGAFGTATLQAAPSVTITTTRENSIIFGCTADWKAISGTTRTLRDGATERLYFKDGNFTTYHYTKAAATIGAYTLGVSLPTGQQASTSLLEIRGNAAAANTPPTVTTQPTYQTRCAGTNASFTSAASGTPVPTVQWQESTNGTTWTNITGATNATLSFVTATADNNKQYRAVWTNSVSSANSNAATLTVNAIPATPSVNVTNNCGNSVLTASGFTGSLLWSNGATTTSITVATAGIYTVTQTVSGCTSAAGSGIAAPLSSPAAPSVTVGNNCGSSVLTASGYSGSLLWNTGETTPSITVTTGATYSVIQTVNGCTSVTGSGTAVPKAIPSAPNVSVVNNCGSSVLTASGFTGSLSWSNGATTNPITVTTAGIYTVTQTVNGCISASGNGTATPLSSSVATPAVDVVNNCDISVLTASGFTGSLSWSNGATTPSITVTSAGTYTVTQTVSGCTSPAGSGTATPVNTTIAAPAVAVANNCGNSVLTASGFTGTLLWSNAATTNPITVTTAGIYTVTQTINGCTGPSGSGVAAPKAIPVLSGSLTGTATSGTPFAYTPTSTTTGTTFTWTRAVVTGISNTAGSGTAAINETLVNTTTSAVNVTYVYTLTANGCINTQNLVVTVNPAATVNCVINGSITSSFNSTSIPAGRYIWFNSSFNPGSLGSGTAPVTMTITNSVINFTANSQQYTLNVPDSRVRYDASVTSASTQFINNAWETVIPRSYNGYVFMGGLSYQVLSNLPGSISNINWAAKISIDKSNISLTWRWGAAVYTSFAAHSGLNIKPKNGNTQNTYANNDNAGTPENYKSFVVSGAKGSGGTNYTGSYSSTSTATCVVTAAQRSSVQPAITRQSFGKQIPSLSVENGSTEKLEVTVMPNPSNTFFNLAIRGSNKNNVRVRVLDIFGQVVERHDKIAANTTLQLGHSWASGPYFVEVIQDDQRKFVKIIKVN
jgi:hypothetical protein